MDLSTENIENYSYQEESDQQYRENSNAGHRDSLYFVPSSKHTISADPRLSASSSYNLGSTCYRCSKSRCICPGNLDDYRKNKEERLRDITKQAQNVSKIFEQQQKFMIEPYQNVKTRENQKEHVHYQPVKVLQKFQQETQSEEFEESQSSIEESTFRISDSYRDQSESLNDAFESVKKTKKSKSCSRNYSTNVRVTTNQSTHSSASRESESRLRQRVLRSTNRSSSYNSLSRYKVGSNYEKYNTNHSFNYVSKYPLNKILLTNPPATQDQPHGSKTISTTVNQVRNPYKPLLNLKIPDFENQSKLAYFPKYPAQKPTIQPCCCDKIQKTLDSLPTEILTSVKTLLQNIDLSQKSGGDSSYQSKRTAPTTQGTGKRSSVMGSRSSCPNLAESRYKSSYFSSYIPASKQAEAVQNRSSAGNFSENYYKSSSCVIKKENANPNFHNDVSESSIELETRNFKISDVKRPRKTTVVREEIKQLVAPKTHKMSYDSSLARENQSDVSSMLDPEETVAKKLEWGLEVMLLSYKQLEKMLNMGTKECSGVSKSYSLALNMDFRTDYRIFSDFGYKKLPNIKTIELRSVNRLGDRLNRFFEFNAPDICKNLCINPLADSTNKLAFSTIKGAVLGYFTKNLPKITNRAFSRVLFDNFYFDYGEFSELLNSVATLKKDGEIKTEYLLCRNCEIKPVSSGSSKYLGLSHKCNLKRLNLEGSTGSFEMTQAIQAEINSICPKINVIL
ncbi:unnamed protein product [Moneuplotes crassus]|uniref:Uncharacterized protein n=1 Tax=Euplotes crassus TaxID=5936 RepID=A0AAD1Y430_EUPCR|nr:unnamed protein product [Moneuplotes crassus]